MYECNHELLPTESQIIKAWNVILVFFLQMFIWDGLMFLYLLVFFREYHWSGESKMKCYWIKEKMEPFLFQTHSSNYCGNYLWQTLGPLKCLYFIGLLYSVICYSFHTHHNESAQNVQLLLAKTHKINL